MVGGVLGVVIGWLGVAALRHMRPARDRPVPAGRRRHEVAAAVLLAGFAREGESAFRWQAASVFGGLPAPVRLLRRPLAALGERVLSYVKRTRTDVARIAGLLPVNARCACREMLVHDSRDDLAAVPAAVPVLAVTGDKDIQVPPADLDEIRRLVPGGGTEIHRVPDLTHLLRRDSGRPTIRTYRRLLREPVDAELLALVAAWLGAHLREPSHAPSDEWPAPRP
ncbi:hypothetical protein SVIOM342S_07475 [Streptomyces violaceorubidus]